MSDAEQYRIGHLTLQPHRQLLAQGKRLPLGSKALALISVLATRRGDLVTKDELMEAVWPGIIVEENAIQVHIAALRKLMGNAADRLVTVRGVGYRLDADFTLDDEPAPAPDAPQQEISTAQPVLAVLPFDNLSSDPELAYFCDGVSEEILSRITRRSMLTVIGRTSSFQFRAAGKAAAAATLKASHVLDGSIQRAGGRIRVSAHLLNCASQASQWSQHYDRSLEDIFAVQDEIAEAIADALKSNFAPAAPAAAADPATYDLYLRAKERVTSTTAMQRNIASLERVTQMADGFGPGWATLAYRRAELSMHLPYHQRADMRGRIEGEIAKGEQLDPGHPDALAAQWVLMPPFGSLTEQEEMLNTSDIANPDFVDLLTARAYFLECAGRSQEAVEQAGRAARLDSLNPFAMGLHSQAMWFAGYFDEARAAMEHVRHKWPDSHHTVAVLIQAYTHQQDWAAVDRLTDPARLAVYPLREHSGVVAFARVMRNPSERNRRLMFDTICKRATAHGHVDAQVATVAAELGFVDETFALLDTCRFGPAGKSGDVMGTHAYRTLLLFPKAYQKLRSDPRFVKICARLGLVEYWLESQCWPDCADDVSYDFRAECEALRGFPKDDLLH